MIRERERESGKKETDIEISKRWVMWKGGERERVRDTEYKKGITKREGERVRDTEIEKRGRWRQSYSLSV